MRLKINEARRGSRGLRIACQKSDNQPTHPLAPLHWFGRPKEFL